MPAPHDRTIAMTARPSRREMLRRFLETYWLRPENAFWMCLRSETLGSCSFAAPSADLCCGDGLFSFIHHGGVLAPTFDVFGAVATLDPGRPSASDMFDHVDNDYQPQILHPPPRRMAVGTDLKKNLLAKAARLDLYDRLVEHDGNQPLPFAADSFETVYCNSAYWIRAIDGFLSELHRVVTSTGRVILHVKLDSFRRYTLAAHRAVLGDRFLEILVGRRLDSWPTLAGRSVWEKRFARAGFMVESVVPFVTKMHAHIWEVGLRPIAPLLIKMANGLAPPTRAAIKAEWVALFLDLTEPLCDPALNFSATRDEPAEMQYVLARPPRA